MSSLPPPCQWSDVRHRDHNQCCVASVHPPASLMCTHCARHSALRPLRCSSSGRQRSVTEAATPQGGGGGGGRSRGPAAAAAAAAACCGLGGGGAPAPVLHPSTSSVRCCRKGASARSRADVTCCGGSGKGSPGLVVVRVYVSVWYLAVRQQVQTGRGRCSGGACMQQYPRKQLPEAVVDT